MTNIRHYRQRLGGGLTPPSSITWIVIVTKINKKKKLTHLRLINFTYLDV